MKPEVNISIHDKYQLEFKIVCPIRKESKLNDYYADSFFFLPRNLAVNPHSYTGKEFYNDLSEYIRFKTPAVNLHELAKENNATLKRLSDSISAMPGKEEFSRHLKMYCSIVRSAFRDNVSHLLAMPPAEHSAALTLYLADSMRVLKKYRKLRKKLLSHPERLELYDLVDEFLSITFNRCIYRLRNALPPDPALQKKLAEHAFREIKYRRVKNCPSVPEAEKDNSELLYRESTLKKAMGSILFLKVATRKDGVLIENILLGIAAAIAMIFVTGIAFLWRGLFLEEFSLSFFIVWVVAYMFKDRIKSQLQLLCINKRSRYAYDYRQKVYDGLGNEIGICREGFRHCDGSDLNDSELLRVRNRTTLSRLEDGSLNENVLVYRKKIELFGDGCKNIFQEFDVNGIVNIYRFNIRHWLYKMDNPKQTIFLSDGKQIRPIKAFRDYHVNIVLRYGEKGGKEEYIRYRLVLCRSGIRKLECFTAPN